MGFLSSLGDIGKVVTGFGPLLDIGGALLGADTVKDTNKQNAALARESRDWEERMSNTAYQRARTDLEAAGLNPMLAIGKAASTPSSPTATMQSAGDILSRGGSSAVSHSLENKSIQESIMTQRSQQAVNNATAANLVIDAETKRAEADKRKVTSATEQLEAKNRGFEAAVRKSRPAWQKALGVTISDMINTVNPLKGFFK
ncbi:MAG: DNA pilot protein [Microviridae sp.]|nr:MAG: DNA pilot protein [Microviridae sp.]